MHRNHFFQIGRKRISETSMPYMIAEIGVNHAGSMQKAVMMIRHAKKAGADAVKFQSYKAGSLASRHSPAYWDTAKEPTRSQYQLFKKFDRFSERQYRALAGVCRSEGIDFLSTPFDDDAVEFLYPLLKCYKIASADITYLPFLAHIARKRKPVILSTGASTVAEIAQAIKTLKKNGCPAIALLHCVLKYPTDYASANLHMIEGLRDAFPGMVIGYSDHTLPDPAMAILTTAYCLGARIIEKHFTYDKTLPGNDHYHAMDACDLAVAVRSITLARQALGERRKRPLASESGARRQARRSLVVARDVSAGQRLTRFDLTGKRPGTGISPALLNSVAGSYAARDLPEDHVLSWRDIQRKRPNR